MDIPSLFMIPSAVSSGKVHSVFPNSTDADFDFNRDSDATRVNSEGLIERVGYYGSELVTNGDFSNGTNNWSFTDANGQVGSYFSRNEVCEIDFTNTSTIYASQSSILSNSKSYKITLDYYIPSTNASANYIQVRLGTTSSTSALTPNLNVLDNWTSATLYGVSNGTDLYIYTPSGAIGDKFYIDNVSVVEITGDRARLNYEIEGGLVNTKPSLLLEPQSTNLVTYSEDFSQWVVDGQASISSNSIISPDGTRNSDKLIAGTTSGRQAIKFSVSQTGNLAFSIFAKKEEYSAIQLSDAQNASAFANFNLETGVVGSTGVYTASMVDMGNDWYRCIITWNASVAINAIRVGIVTTATSARVEQFAGNGINGLYIYGAQLEQLSYATSYIPTNGSTQTRAAETCNGAGTSSILPSEEGILYAEIAALESPTTSALDISISNGATTNYVRLEYYTDGKIYGTIYDGSFAAGSATVTQTNFNKIAVQWKSSGSKFALNGVITDFTGKTFSANTFNTLQFAAGNGTSAPYYGKIRDIRVYNTKEMTDSEVDILLTKITS